MRGKARTPLTRHTARRIMSKVIRDIPVMAETLDVPTETLDSMLYELADLSVHVEAAEELPVLTPEMSAGEMWQAVQAYMETPLATVQAAERAVAEANAAIDPVLAPVPPDDMDAGEKKDAKRTK